LKRMELLLVGLSMVMLVAICGSKALAQGTAPVAGSELVAVGVTVTQLTDVVKGWSVKKKILGHDIYNDKNEKVGSIDDLIVGPDKASSFLIVGAGGFLGIDRHDVAIPVKQIQEKDGKFVLPGATKEVVKAMPEFRYAK
jgi:sporulation protein YlmC with PRC-barrel domain